MPSVQDHIASFLQLPAVAVVGVSATRPAVANAVLLKLKDGRRTVYGVARSAPVLNGDQCYPSLMSLPSPVQGVFIAARPENIAAIAEECVAAKVRYLWIHHMPGTQHPADAPLSAVIGRCRAAGITVIPGACPMMFVPDADLGHRCIKWFLSLTGRLR
ncbi:MAG: CoA-binding protein [Bacteroidetes bacterium]|nr:CoA-binding protein [Bacteroidota bacterium]